LPPRILIHGREGVGKATLASRFPNPVLIDLEGGVPSGISIPGFGRMGAVQDIYDAVMALGRGLPEEPHGYRTVIVDSVDRLEPLVWAAVTAANGWASMESPGFGKAYVMTDWHWVRVLNGLDWLRALGMTVVLLAHSAAEMVSDPRAASYTSYQLRVHRRARGILQDWADAIGFLATDVVVHSEDIGFNKTRGRGDGGNTRWLHWEARPAFVAKNRYGLPATARRDAKRSLFILAPCAKKYFDHVKRLPAPWLSASF
jgi:hypothetical protein